VDRPRGLMRTMGGRRAFRRLSGTATETATVGDMTAEGAGLATVAGKRVFIDGAIGGEIVSFRRTKARRNYDEAELLAVESASPERVAPRCRYFGTCGGCALQHLSTDGQLRLKEATLRENLRRIGNVEPAEWLIPVSAAPWGYRRRARLAARFVDGKGRVLVGFSERDSSWVADMDSCETLHPRAAALIAPLGELISSLGIARRVPQVEIVVADNATALVLRALDDPATDDLARLRSFRTAHDCRLLLQRAGPDDIRGLDPATDEGDLWYDIDGVRLRFGSTDFIQVNAAVNQVLVERVLAEFDPQPDSRLLDLFCGIGNFTLPLARRAAHVLGVEADKRMVALAAQNAATNGIVAARFVAADLSSSAGGTVFATTPWDGVLLDPPRAGAAAILAPVAATGTRRIVYVSCHPGTLARDAGTLVHEFGFRLVRAGIFDMFPATSHVESLAVFERSGRSAS
jgi:23S rRNA (uracil1939-C5)-methyltransferase